MAMEPEACIAPNGEPLEEVSGGRGRFHGAGSVGNCLAQGANGEGSRLSRGEDHIPDRVVARDAVAIAPTADLVVPEDVSNSMAFRAGVGAVVDGDTQPVPQRTPKFTVLEAKALVGAEDSRSCMV